MIIVVSENVGSVGEPFARELLAAHVRCSTPDRLMLELHAVIKPIVIFVRMQPTQEHLTLCFESRARVLVELEAFG